jgi:hypothetical protein
MIKHETPGAESGARKNLKLARHNNPRSDNPFNLNFLDLKATTLLSHALHVETPPAVAAASGAQLVLLLRENGITADQLMFAIVRGQEPWTA